MCVTLVYVEQTKRNLTLSLPGALIRDVKVIAAKRDESLNSLIEQMLAKLVEDEDAYWAAGARILSPARRSLYRITSKVKRDELYER